MEITSNSYLSLLKAATKTIKDDRWKLQTWRHKAVRRAYGDFMIPKGRKIEAFEEIENLNDSVLELADISSGISLTIENENALKQLGVVLQKYNGVAIASNFQGKEKHLQEMGFTKNGGNWSITYEETPPKIVQNIPPTPQKDPAILLNEYLKSLGLSKKQIKDFVSDVLGLTSQDTEGIKEVLEDISLLDKMIADFMEQDKESSEVEDVNTLF